MTGVKRTDVSALAGADDELMVMARRAAASAYCRYSGIAVGAALECADGRVFCGCNIENASFGLTICAERSAAAAAVSAGARDFVRIAIALAEDSSKVGRFAPCGACLQFLSEFADADFVISVEGAGDFALSDLLGRPFIYS